MLFTDEAKCPICKRIFCCAKCRQKHQVETHAIAVNQHQQIRHQPATDISESNGDIENNSNSETSQSSATIYVFCPICEQKPLTLREGMYAELLAHIESEHLPLRCRKCHRHYTKSVHLLEFGKCVGLGQDCSAGSASSVDSVDQNQSCDTDASKVTVKKATVAASTISTQTSPSIAKDLNGTQHHHVQQQQQRQQLTPISLFNLRWKAKSRLAQEEFISDSVSSIRNLSTDSVNLSVHQRCSISGQMIPPPDTAHSSKGKVIRSTSTPLQIGGLFAKPKEALTFNASGGGGGHMSSIYNSGYVLDEHNTPAAVAQHSYQPHQRPWQVGGGRGRRSAVTPLHQVMSKSIQKAFVEHGVGMLTTQTQGGQRRIRLDLSEQNAPEVGSPLDLRLSPVVRRTQSQSNIEMQQTNTQPYQIMLSAQKLTTESIIITRTQHGGRSGSLPTTSTTSASGSTVYNSCENVEIITSSELSAAVQPMPVGLPLPPITPNTRIPGAIINKKLIKFETPQKKGSHVEHTDDSFAEEKEIFYTPNPAPISSPAASDLSPTTKLGTTNERRREQIVPRQLSDQFSSTEEGQKLNPVQRPQGPRARPPLRVCEQSRAFSCVQDIESDEEIFLPNGASTHNDRKRSADVVAQAEPGRLWSLVSSVMRLPASLRSDKDNANNTTSHSGSLIRRCASIAGSLVRTKHIAEDADIHTMKRKRTHTLDNQYVATQMSPSSSSKRLRIQPRKPIDRMRNN